MCDVSRRYADRGRATPTLTDVRVEQAWVRRLPANLPAADDAVTAIDGGAAVSLTGARSPDYEMVMPHRSRLEMSDSTMEMVDHLDIPAHGIVQLAPGG